MFEKLKHMKNYLNKIVFLYLKKLEGVLKLKMKTSKTIKNKGERRLSHPFWMAQAIAGSAGNLTRRVEGGRHKVTPPKGVVLGPRNQNPPTSACKRNLFYIFYNFHNFYNLVINGALTS